MRSILAGLGQTYIWCRKCTWAAALAFPVMLATQSAAAYPVWQWRVLGTYTGETLRVAGPSPVVATKGQALSTLRSLEPPWSTLLTLEEGPTNVSSQEFVTYEFRAPTAPRTLTPWTYRPEMAGYVGESESAAEDALRSYWTAYCGAGTTVTAISDWISTFSTFWGSKNEIKSFRVVGNCIPSTFSVAIGRERESTCPSPYYVDVWDGVNPMLCISHVVGRIEGRLLECPSTGPSTQVGNPCDAISGDKSQVEADYLGPGLKFTRYYHSATLLSARGFGVGWTHSYASRAIISGNALVGLVRPNGYLERMLPGPLSSASGLTAEHVGSQWKVFLRSGGYELYSANGNLVQIVEPGPSITTINYDADGQISSVVGPAGHTLNFVFVSGRLTELIDPAGQSIHYAYDSIGNLASVQYQDGSLRTYHYEDAGFPNHLTGITDEATNRYATYSYDTTGRVSTSQHAGGAGFVSLSYGASNTTVNDGIGGVKVFGFDDNGRRRATSVSLNGLVASYPLWTGDPLRRVSQMTDRRGLITKYTYDLSNLASVTEAFGTPRQRLTSYTESDWRNSLPSAINEPGQKTEFTYANWKVTQRKVTDLALGQSRIWNYTYDPQGRVLTADGPRADVPDVTSYTYYGCSSGSQCGQVHTITDALYHVATYNTYNAHGQPLSITDPNGAETILTYDLRQRLTSRTVGGEQTTFDYWPTGLLKKVTLPDGSFTQYDYDAAHRLTQISDAEGNRIVYTLDAMGNRTAEQHYDPSNTLTQTRTRVFNTLNQLWKEIGAAGTPAVTTEFGYDDNGNRTSINAPLNRNTVEVYDELNRLKQVTDPLSGIAQYGYNPLDQLTSVADPRGLNTTYNYNALGDLLQQSSPDSGATGYTYDEAGNVATRTDARGASVGHAIYGHDALNRVAQIQYPDHSITYSYDSCPNGVGRLCGMTDASGSTAYEYDPLGRVTRKSQSTPIGALTHTRTVRYEYVSGRLSALRMPEGERINYSYDVAGRISAMSITWPDNSTTPLLSNVLYDPAGRVRGWTWANGMFEVREYDQDGRITDLDNAGASQYGYDDADRITSISSLAGNTSLSWSYGYDLLDRLTGANRAGLAESFTYDANGNRLTQGGTQTSTYSYSNPLTSNRLQSVSGAVNRTYSYDAMGNITGNGIVSFGYDGAGRMSSAGSVTYRYNGVAQRTAKSLWANDLTGYLFDEAGHLLERCDVSSAGQCASFFSTQYIWLGDIPVAALLPHIEYNEEGYVSVFYVGLYNVHTDHLNTPRRLTQENGAVVWQWDPDPFGVGQPNANVLGNPYAAGYDMDLRFPGQIFDPENWPWLHYNYYRDGYDAATGRYTQVDPIGLAGGLNPYVYLSGNPVDAVDPLGLSEAGDQIRSVGLRRAIGGLDAAMRARGIAERSGLPGGPHNSLEDAYRHCLWSCLLAQSMGEQVARRIGDTHEAANRKNNQPQDEEDMDQANNAAGRLCIQPIGPKPCTERCRDLLMSGQLFGLGGRPMPVPPNPPAASTGGRYGRYDP